MEPRTMNHLDRITIEPDKLGGKPCIRGLRISAQQVLGMLANGVTEQQILEDFPDIEHEDILAVLQWALERATGKQVG